METTQNTDLQAARDLAHRLVEDCTDEDLLDLICRLLVHSGGS